MAAINFRLELLESIVLTTIMVDHYPLSEFLHAAKLFIMCIKAISSSFMLCSFGISTEASAPAVLSLTNDCVLCHLLSVVTAISEIEQYIILYYNYSHLYGMPNVSKLKKLPYLCIYVCIYKSMSRYIYSFSRFIYPCPD